MYLSYAISGAIDEVTLVLFTTFAPSGALAYVLMSLPCIFRGASLPPERRRSIEKYLSVPVLAAMVGLVASTTHLGSPANALYVLTGVGRSPLSNEVVTGVLFLGCAGVFWLSSFSASERSEAFRRLALAVISLLAILFIGAISLAYNAETIITWNHPLASLSIWINAFVGGPLLALFGFRLARFYTADHALGKVMLVLSAVGLVANVVIYAVWGGMLPTLSNSMASADSLVPSFVPMVIAFAVLCAIGIALGIKAVCADGEAPFWVFVCSIFCVFLGIFIMRFAFYMMHMTVGLGI